MKPARTAPDRSAVAAKTPARASRRALHARLAGYAFVLFVLDACASAERTTPAAPLSAEHVAPPSPKPDPGSTGAPTPRSMTVLISRESASAYCNGEQMDSAGYRKTLTREKRIELPAAGASDTEVVRAVVDAATEGMCQTVMSQLEYRNEGGTLHIPPFDAWAGVSITMCSCQPEVELNFARIPGVARVVWDGD